MPQFSWERSGDLLPAIKISKSRKYNAKRCRTADARDTVVVLGTSRFGDLGTFGSPFLVPSGVLTKGDVPMHCRQVPKPVRWKTCQRQNQYEEKKGMAWSSCHQVGHSLARRGGWQYFPR